jgi:hypothetical protein
MRGENKKKKFSCVSLLFIVVREMGCSVFLHPDICGKADAVVIVKGGKYERGTCTDFVPLCTAESEIDSAFTLWLVLPIGISDLPC